MRRGRDRSTSTALAIRIIRSSREGDHASADFGQKLLDEKRQADKRQRTQVRGRRAVIS